MSESEIDFNLTMSPAEQERAERIAELSARVAGGETITEHEVLEALEPDDYAKREMMQLILEELRRNYRGTNEAE